MLISYYHWHAASSFQHHRKTAIWDWNFYFKFDMASIYTNVHKSGEIATHTLSKHTKLGSWMTRGQWHSIIAWLFPILKLWFKFLTFQWFYSCLVSCETEAL